MTAKLTEGPWRLFKRDDDPRWFIVAGDYANVGEPDLYAEITTSNPADARALANAKRLFFMLDSVLNASRSEEYAELYKLARALLAEVKGGAS